MSYLLWYTKRMNNMNNDTYTLWNEGTLLWKGEHTRATFDEMLEEAYDLDGTVEIYSSRDDLVWSSYGDEPNEPSDAWHDADALASAGYGMDEDYGCYGGDCWE